MKIWIKLLAGVVIGLLVGHFLPFSRESLNYASSLVQNIGRYGIYPLLFFSLPLAIQELKKENKILRVFGRSFVYMIITSLSLVIIGTLLALILSPNRIPIIVERGAILALPHIRDILVQIFPKNLFNLGMDDGNFLLPIYVFSFILGINFTFDRIITRPAVQLFDSFSRIFYHFNTLLVEVTGIGIIAIAAYWYSSVNTIADIEIFSQTLTLLTISCILVTLGVIPLILYLTANHENPFKRLYALITPVITAFFSGNLLFGLPSLLHHGKENLGIPRKSGISLLPLYIMFGKAGSAMVSGSIFLLIIHSYSSLGITVSTVLWVILFSFLVSLVSSPLPGMGVHAGLVFLCTQYGQGLEEGYLIIMPIMPILQSIAAALDILCAGLAVYLASRHELFTKETRVKDYA